MQQTGLKLLTICLSIYIAFNLLWGLNYNRIPMAKQVGLSLSPYSTQNLQAVAKALIDTLNTFGSTNQELRRQLGVKKYCFVKRCKPMPW